jgi:iron complex outermembrane receptor protein
MTHTPLLRFARALLCAALALPVVASLATTPLTAQMSASLSGTVLDPRGVALPGAAVSVKNDATGATQKVTSDGQGHYSFTGLAAGKYTLQVDANGFTTTKKTDVMVSAGQSTELPVSMQMGNVSEEITVESNEAGSVAAALAPLDALLGETSPRTEITKSFIANFSSPIADYGALVGMAPSTITLNGNGVGLGQSKTYFRGFPDGDYDIDFDGIPFYDTNTPTHHSWAFFPAQFLGGIDFDRSPGTASTIGPTPFGGSIHLLSQDLSPVQNLRATFSGGSFNTFLYDLAYDSGSFGPGKKMSTSIDVHHMQSHGYQSLNNQARNAGAIKFQYKLSDKAALTGFSGVIWLDANTPNFSATRCQMYGVSPTNAYSCIISGTTLYPYTGAGINFLLTNPSDPLLYLDTTYNFYHVPTDFEYVGLHQEFAHGFSLDIKPYTYNYDNSEKYANATTITEATTVNGLKTYMGLPIAPCNVAVTKKGVTAIPCGVDKYNSYRKYGETSQLSQVSKYGVFNAGMWYEWANTNRHQYPSDPLNNWADQALPNFAEKFVTDSYQPFAEYQYHATKQLTITPGVKFAYYTIGTQQFADDGKTIGGLGTNNPASFIANGGSYFATLPSLSLNYRIQNNWSAFAQVAQGSIVPPSSVFDFQQGSSGVAIPPATLPKQQKNTTYEAGTVLKLKRVTFDADYYHIHFDNSYSSTLNAAGEPVFYVQPSSITQGVEGESNVYLGQGLSVYLNASYDRAVYQGSLAAACTGSTTACATAGQLNVTAPSGLYVQQTPSDIENEGITYQKKSWNAAFFNQRVGTMYIDNGAYHNQYTVNPFDTANAFINYTVMNGGRFNQTKIQLAFNNIFNQSSVTGITLAGSPVTQTISYGGTTFTDPFNTAGQTPINGQDNVSILAARSIMLSVTFGLSPKR